MPASARRFEAAPYAFADALRLVEELGVSRPVATALVRRGYADPEGARAFLEGSEQHDPFAFAGMEEVVEALGEAIDSGTPITVYGDFDCDGVCSTTILVQGLREAGARCDWFIPDRIADGYGLSAEALDSIAGRGTGLVVSVDCGITAVEEVEHAKSLGMLPIVTDHHQPKDELPDCLFVHPALSGYPFAELCGAAVAHKVACALREMLGAEPERDRADLDLVALATVTDVVPLIGENRRLVRQGLEVMRRAARPGLRALMGISATEPSRVREDDLAFRLGPRINAAGRMYRADAGVELFTTGSGERAAEVADELNRANMDRRSVEREVEATAEAARREQAEEGAPALVLAGDGWHAGVLGIVASRLAERHGVPAVLISLDGDRGKGSGRSVPGYDLLEGISAGAEHLVRFGGHRAAAGLEIEAGRVEEFRRAFTEHARRALGEEPASPAHPVDAMVGGEDVGLTLAEELERLGPFGEGNPPVSLLVPGGRITDVAPMGEGKHARFNLRTGGHRAAGVCFGRSSFGVGDGDRVDVAVRLEVNQWNGSVEPRLLLRELYPLDAPEPAGEEPLAELCDLPTWWQRFDAEHDREPAPPSGPEPASPAERIPLLHGGLPGITLAELVSTGEGTLILTADALRRADALGGSVGLSRFGGVEGAVVSGRCDLATIELAAEHAEGGVVIADYEALAVCPALAAPFQHLALLDPPAFPGDEARTFGGEGIRHEIWSPSEVSFAERVASEQWQLTPLLRALYRELREAGELEGEALMRVLSGGGRRPRSAELAARLARVLGEVGLVRLERGGGAHSLGVVSSEKVDLESSGAFRGYEAVFREAKTFLSRPRQQKRAA